MTEANTMLLSDGRPINNAERIRLIEEIKETGVCGHHLQMLGTVFDAKVDECQVALNISVNLWKQRTKSIGQLNDAALTILITWFLHNPEEWPIAYRPKPDFDKIENYFRGSVSSSLLVGRSQHARYRWDVRPPKDHVKVLLTIMERGIRLSESMDKKQQIEGKKILEQYLQIVNSEADRRDVNLTQDKGWTKK